jgi:hypothetical protein
MLMTGAGHVDAERAFSRAVNQRRRDAVLGRVRRRRTAARLPVLDASALSAAAGQIGARGVREIPIDAISGTIEPSKASLFDAAFRPRAAAVRRRWQRVWLAEHRGAGLPPISLVRVGDGYAVSDGHHRVSVARARGATTIDATVAGFAAA